MRKATSLLAGFSLMLLMSTTAIAADKELYGTWRLVSFTQTVVATGETKDIFGKSPQGIFVAGRDGRYTFLIVSDKRPKVPDLAKLTDPERVELFKTMIAYSGKYTFDGKTLKIRLDISWNENWTGTELVRHVKFEGDKLLLSTIPAPASQHGKIVTAVLTWERIE
ncbi:MAG: lipocalin-like domain-containing protein [Syntrophales bacterium]